MCESFIYFRFSVVFMCVFQLDALFLLKVRLQNISRMFNLARLETMENHQPKSIKKRKSDEGKPDEIDKIRKINI